MNTNTNITATNKGNDMNTHRTYHVTLTVGNNVAVREFDRSFNVVNVVVGNVINYTNARTGNAQRFVIVSTSANAIVARLTYA